MSNVDIFVIEYKLHGQPKSFVIRAKTMRNADAWHWASCDAGIAPIPKPGKPPLKVISKPQAERFGITEVKWRETATVDWMGVLPICLSMIKPPSSPPLPSRAISPR